MKEWKNKDGEFEWIVAPHRPRAKLGAVLRKRTKTIRQMRELLRAVEQSHYWDLNQYRLQLGSTTGTRRESDVDMDRDEAPPDPVALPSIVLRFPGYSSSDDDEAVSERRWEKWKNW